jgi:hypothetical protein
MVKIVELIQHKGNALFVMLMQGVNGLYYSVLDFFKRAVWF